MKSILLSIKPKWCAKILNGEKTIEIRKTMPRCDLPIDVYIYCTNDKDLILVKNICIPCCSRKFPYQLFYKELEDKGEYKNDYIKLSGKVIAKFTLRKVEELFTDENGVSYYTDTITKDFEVSKLACIDDDDITNYLSGVIGYAWHIEDLVIFDKPKELKEFWHYKKETDCGFCIIRSYSDEKHRKPRKLLVPLTKAPQSYCFVESEE